MSPLWQFKAVSVFLYYNLPHAPSSQPFLISHFVAACEVPLFLSVFHNELWRYSEACAAENSCLCKRGPASCSVSARLTLKISLKAAARIAHRRADTKTNMPSHTAAPGRAAAGPQLRSILLSLLTLLNGAIASWRWLKQSLLSHGHYSVDD